MRNLDPFAEPATVEYFDLASKQAELAALPPVDGAWPMPASLSRLNFKKMPFKMLRRFEKKIEFGWTGYMLGGNKSNCWLWTGGTHPKGYGRFWLGEDEDGFKIWAYSHRIAFEHWVGFPPAGYIVDHMCNVKTCCNPVHLWPETNARNLELAAERRPWKRRNQYSKE